MIFNSEYTGTSSYDDMVVTESPYPLGLEGALMHVYENECNYNAMMKAIGISELRYYQETGGDLFIQEAGAFGGFIAKAKAFFKKIIEKIKQIFHKFMATINQYTMSDKDFVKKYQKELYRKNLTDFEFDGYSFKDLDTNARDIAANFIAITNNTTNVDIDIDDSGKYVKATRATINSIDFHSDDIDTNELKKSLAAYDKSDSDDVEDRKDKNRGRMLNGDNSNNAYDHSEFMEELKEKLYGDDGKETLEIKNIREWVNYITETKNDLKSVDNIQKAVIKSIDKFISEIEKAQTKYAKIDDAERKDTTGNASKEKNKVIKGASCAIDIMRSASNDATTAFGMITQAYKDRNRQAKAICVKALSYKYKNESATYIESSYDSDDIFAGVVIR